MMEYLKALNWVDILVVVLLIRIVYVSAKTGFVVEFMKMLGVLFAVFFAFHFYVRLAAIAGQLIKVDAAILQTVSFCIIGIVSYWLCQLLRNALFLVFTVETISLVDRWGAAVVSLVRFFLTASMVLFLFLITSYPYMIKMTAASLSERYVLRMAPTTYFTITNAFVVKLFPTQRANPSVAEELSKVNAQ